MQSQYLITKDENGNYVIANSQDGEKLCGLNCSGDDPCKNCDKCVKQQPVIAPTLMPSLIPSPTPLGPNTTQPVPITSNPVMIAKFKRSISNNPTPNSIFINEGKLTAISIVLIVAGVLLVFIAIYYMLKKYKKHRKFKNRRGGKGMDKDAGYTYINDDFDDFDDFDDDVEEY